jgi:hypothetical protein
MSLLDDVSIVVTPNGYKAGTLYGVIPSDGAADMDVTRATAATRVNEQGLIEEVPYNLLQQSNTFNTTWTLSSSIDLTSGQSGVGGSTDAWLLKRNSTGSRYIAQALSLSSAQYSFSVYLKAESTNWAYIWSYDGTTQNNAYFDLQNGVVGNTSGANFDGTKIESVGDGWYRCTLIYTQATTIVRIYPAYSNGSISIGTDNGIYIQYSQLEVGSTSKTYLPTTTRFNVPRIDYTGGGCPHILAEPQRTNTVIYSEDFSQYDTGGSTAPTLTTGQLAPDGTFTATKVSGVIGNTSIFARDESSTTASRSIYARTVSGTGTAKLMSYYLNTNNTFTITEEWQRFELTGAIATGGTNFYAIDFRDYSTTLSELIIWGGQSEEATYPTSYIPTSGSTVTRNQDVFSRDGIGSLINSTEGVLFAEIAALNSGTGSIIISINDGSLSNSVAIYYYSNENNVAANIFSGGNSPSLVGTIPNSGTKYDFNKIALKYKSGDSTLWVNGIEVFTLGDSISLTGLNKISFDYGNGIFPFYGKVKQLQVYDTALTDMQLIQLTGTSGTDFYESYSEMAESLTYTIQ